MWMVDNLSKLESMPTGNGDNEFDYEIVAVKENW